MSHVECSSECPCVNETMTFCGCDCEECYSKFRDPDDGENVMECICPDCKCEGVTDLREF